MQQNDKCATFGLGCAQVKVQHTSTDVLQSNMCIPETNILHFNMLPQLYKVGRVFPMVILPEFCMW